MLHSEARRLLVLRREIEGLERQIEVISFKSELAQRIDSIPGFGLICSAALPGEIGDLASFAIGCVSRQLVWMIWSMVKKGRNYQAAYHSERK
jgi:transposase